MKHRHQSEWTNNDEQKLFENLYIGSKSKHFHSEVVPSHTNSIKISSSRLNYFMASELSEVTSLHYESGLKLINDAEDTQKKNLGITYSMAKLKYFLPIATNIQKLEQYTIYEIENHTSQIYELQKFTFHYFKININNKSQPILINFKPQIDSNFKGRLFLSTFTERPNSFNCDYEYKGPKIKFQQNSNGAGRFVGNFLHITLFSHEISLIQVQYKFGSAQHRETSRSPTKGSPEQIFFRHYPLPELPSSPSQSSRLSMKPLDFTKVRLARPDQNKIDSEFTHQLYVRKNKKVLDLKNHVDLVRQQHRNQLKVIVNCAARETKKHKEKRNQFDQTWTFLIQGSFYLIELVRSTLERERGKYVKLSRGRLLQKITMSMFFKRQKQWGESVRQRLMVDIFHSCVFAINVLHNSHENKKFNETIIIKDFLFQNGQVYNVFRSITKLMDLVKKIVRKWQIFKKLKLAYRLKIKQSIAFAIQEIHDFLLINSNQNELADKLILMKQKQLLEQYNIAQGISKRKSLPTFTVLMQNNQSEKKLRDSLTLQLLDAQFLVLLKSQFLQNLALIYTKKQHSRWSGLINQNSKNQDKPEDKINQVPIPFLFTDVDWLLLIDVVRSQLIRRGFIPQTL